MRENTDTAVCVTTIFSMLGIILFLAAENLMYFARKGAGAATQAAADIISSHTCFFSTPDELACYVNQSSSNATFNPLPAAEKVAKHTFRDFNLHENGFYTLAWACFAVVGVAAAFGCVFGAIRRRQDSLLSRDTSDTDGASATGSGYQAVRSA